MIKRRNKILITFLIILFIAILIFVLPTKINSNAWSTVQATLLKHKNEFVTTPKYAIYIDYSKPIYKKRLWVLDLSKKVVVFNSHISHAWKSGFFKPHQFSNQPESKISCKGTFKTLNQYTSTIGYGQYKIGMRIKGLDQNKNDNAFKRNIVFHSSLTLWSSGCFMTYPKTNKAIIELTKDGSIIIVE